MATSVVTKDMIQDNDLYLNLMRKGYDLEKHREWKNWGSSPNKLLRLDEGSIKGAEELKRLSSLIISGYVRKSNATNTPHVIEAIMVKYYQPPTSSFRILWRYSCDLDGYYYPRTPMTSDEDAPDWSEEED